MNIHEPKLKKKKKQFAEGTEWPYLAKYMENWINRWNAGIGSEANFNICTRNRFFFVSPVQI